MTNLTDESPSLDPGQNGASYWFQAPSIFEQDPTDDDLRREVFAYQREADEASTFGYRFSVAYNVAAFSKAYEDWNPEKKDKALISLYDHFRAA